MWQGQPRILQDQVVALDEDLRGPRYWIDYERGRDRVRYVSAATGDVDGDGRDEIVTGFSDHNSAPQVVTLDQWTKRFPNTAGKGRDAEIEVREFFELEDFAPSPTIEKFREIGIGSRP